MRVLQSSSLRWLFLSLTLVISIVAIAASVTGQFTSAGQLASVASAFATILLVTLTAQYAKQTQQLVDESRKTREYQLKEQKFERDRELDSLRRALYAEINEVKNIDEFAESYDVSKSPIGLPVPSTIYETNAAKVGLLTDNEVECVVEYYSRVEAIQEYMELQERIDTSLDMDAMTEFFKRMNALFERALHTLSLGRVGSRGTQQRSEVISQRLQALSQSQEAALDSLEEQLVDSRDVSPPSEDIQ